MIDVLPVRTPTVPPATHTNVYRVGRTVFDPGSPWPDEQARLAAWLRDGVDRVVVTHHHGDHTGGVADLAERFGVPVYAHRDARLPFPVAGHLADGDVLDCGPARVRCVHTPGHADGHLVFLLQETGDVIAGDLVAGIGTIVLAEPEGHLATYVASLERMIPLAGRLHPAHGPAIDDGPAYLAQYVAHRHARTAQVAAVLALGPNGPAGIAAHVYAGVPGVDLALAAVQVGTHLRWLVERGRAVLRDDGTFAQE